MRLHVLTLGQQILRDHCMHADVSGLTWKQFYLLLSTGHKIVALFFCLLSKTLFTVEMHLTPNTCQ